MATLKRKKQTVLITGGAGFIGSNLARYHFEQDDRIFIIDDLSSGVIENMSDFLNNPNVHFIHSDLITCKELPNLLAEADRVYHLAAAVGNQYVLDHPFSTLIKNVSSCQKILEMAAEHNPTVRMIMASSSEVYGFSLSEVLSEGDILCLNPPHKIRSEYAISKLLTESFSQAYAKKYQLPVTAVRLFNTIGLHQTSHYGMVVPRFLKQALAQNPVTVIGDGSQKRCFSDVRDTVVMLDKLANSKEAIGMTVNLGASNEISIEELAKLVIQSSKSHSKIQYVNPTEVYGCRFDDIPRRKPNLDLLHQLINHTPKFGLEDTILHLIDHNKVKDNNEN